MAELLTRWHLMRLAEVGDALTQAALPQACPQPVSIWLICRSGSWP
jgi:hypothetical protein